MSSSPTTKDLEAKIVILGASNVGKTTLLSAYLHDGSSSQPNPVPTVGASFQTKRLISPPDAPDTTLRLQIWDTAGQERFRSISRLYYRGADAALLCYDVTDEHSFVEMGRWMQELRAQCGPDTVVHVVGTKADIVAADPSRRQVPFERCIQYVAEHLADQQALSSSASTTPGGFRRPATSSAASIALASAVASRAAAAAAANRNSGVWDHSDASWDCCHEISARDGEGVDEVFRVIVRELVERHNRHERTLDTPGFSESGGGYFDYSHSQNAMAGDGRGSFRLTAAGGGSDNSKRRSWLAAFGGSSHPGTPGTPGLWAVPSANSNAAEHYEQFGDAVPGGGRCC